MGTYPPEIIQAFNELEELEKDLNNKITAFEQKHRQIQLVVLTPVFNVYDKNKGGKIQFATITIYNKTNG